MSTMVAITSRCGIVGRVIDEIASATNTSATELRPPLYDAIDPDALDRLCRDDHSVTVRFEYAGHTVCVQSDNTVTVDELGDGGR